MHETLKNCPFCGAAAHFEMDEGRWEWVECESCGMQGNRSASLMEDCKPKLAEEWNRRTPHPTQAQAGAVPLTPIRKAALDLYTPPFRCEHGYVRDANNQMVADDSGEEMVGVIAARIRGWGRIKYMDNPKGHAAALQDEVGEIVAQALNEHWATHGIKGG